MPLKYNFKIVLLLALVVVTLVLLLTVIIALTSDRKVDIDYEVLNITSNKFAILAAPELFVFDDLIPDTEYDVFISGQHLDVVRTAPAPAGPTLPDLAYGGVSSDYQGGGYHQSQDFHYAIYRIIATDVDSNGHNSERKYSQWYFTELNDQSNWVIDVGRYTQDRFADTDVFIEFRSPVELEVELEDYQPLAYLDRLLEADKFGKGVVSVSAEDRVTEETSAEGISAEGIRAEGIRAEGDAGGSLLRRQERDLLNRTRASGAEFTISPDSDYIDIPIAVELYNRFLDDQREQAGFPRPSEEASESSDREGILPRLRREATTPPPADPVALGSLRLDLEVPGARAKRVTPGRISNSLAVRVGREITQRTEDFAKYESPLPNVSIGLFTDYGFSSTGTIALLNACDRGEEIGAMCERYIEFLDKESRDRGGAPITNNREARAFGQNFRDYYFSREFADDFYREVVLEQGFKGIGAGKSPNDVGTVGCIEIWDDAQGDWGEKYPMLIVDTATVPDFNRLYDMKRYNANVTPNFSGYWIFDMPREIGDRRGGITRWSEQDVCENLEVMTFFDNVAVGSHLRPGDSGTGNEDSSSISENIGIGGTNGSDSNGNSDDDSNDGSDNGDGNKLPPDSGSLSGGKVLGEQISLVGGTIKVNQSGRYRISYSDKVLASVPAREGQTIRFFLDENNNEVRDSTEPFLGNAFAEAVTIEKMDEAEVLELERGWNLVHIGLEVEGGLTAARLSEILAEQDVLALHIMDYRGDSGRSFSRREDGQTYGTDFSIIPGRGYAIFSAETNAKATITGARVDTNTARGLAPGLNLIGLSRSEIEKLELSGFELLASGQATEISKLRAGSFETALVSESRRFGTDLELEANRGYFVLVEVL